MTSSAESGPTFDSDLDKPKYQLIFNIWTYNYTLGLPMICYVPKDSIATWRQIHFTKFRNFENPLDADRIQIRVRK